jgi:pectinesterase
VNCKVTGSGPATVYLGRAWGPYSRVVFAFTEFANIINPVGWYNWQDAAREGTVFYGQYKCFGPGANQANRAAWSHELTDAQAAPFMSLGYIDGSLWVTGE